MKWYEVLGYNENVRDANYLNVTPDKFNFKIKGLNTLWFAVKRNSRNSFDLLMDNSTIGTNTPLIKVINFINGTATKEM